MSMENTEELWKQVNYNLSIPYYSGYIVEYDIRKANINALLSRNIIDQSTYDMLYESDKQYREVYIGNMIKRDPNIYKEIQAGIINAKKQFFKANNIKDSEVLSIKNDAIFVLSSRRMKTKFGLMEFINKGYYTFYFTTSRLQFFYRFDKNKGTDIVEIKGISDNKLNYHKDYLLKFILDTFYNLEMSSIEETLMRCNQFFELYVQRKLDVGFYREFNSDNAFRITRANGKSFCITGAKQEDLKYLNIGYNLRIIRDLINIVNMVYFNTIEKK